MNGIKVTCFAGVCPYEIQVGEKYPVLFELMIFDDYEIEEQDNELLGLECIDGFSYWVKGQLNKGVIECGICFQDEILLSEYGHLDGKFIRIKVDRIDVEFLSKR